MPQQFKVKLPFTDDFPVQVQIRIQSKDNGYLAYIQTNLGKWQRFPIALKQYDVEELNLGLQNAINQVSNTIENESDLKEREKALSELAKEGKYAFNRVFSESLPREMIQSAVRKGATIQITSEEFFIPWELLYDGPLDDKIDASNFWGVQYTISRAIIQDARPGDFVLPAIISSRPRIGLVACNELEYVVKQEIPMLRRLHHEKRIYLSCLRPLDAARHDMDLKTFGRFLRKNIQVFHVAGHACKEEPLSQSYLLVTDSFPITIKDIRLWELKIKHNPFVILNACLTGTMNPFSTSNWASLFWERGARGVLATEFDVPDWFAASFIEELYKHLLSGTPIGESLQITRSYFLEKYVNPLGLAYALYSSPSIRISNQLKE